MSFIPRDLNRAQTHFNVVLDFGKQLRKRLIAADFRFEISDSFKAQSFFRDNLPEGTELELLYESLCLPFAATF